MAKYVLYPNLAAEMARRGETTKDLEKILFLDRSQIYRKLNGFAKLTIGDVETLCEHYNKDFYELFKKNGEEEK